MMTDNLIYKERLSSNRTEALFIGLMILFFLLMIWRVSAVGLDVLAVALLCLSAFFLFYAVNYRTLVIRLTPASLVLKFGVFPWTVSLDDIAAVSLDDVPLLMRMGGAGIHFMSIRGRYRASFNFLEYPRVVIAFKTPVGPVRDISFSTRQPDEVIRLILEAMSNGGAMARGDPAGDPAR